MEELSLKWDEHHPAVISVFEELLAKGTLVDCTIAADGQYMKAHKVVLAACSPYFEHSGSCDDNAMCVENPYHPGINFETTSLSEKCNVFFTKADLKCFNYYKPDVVEMNLRLSLADVATIMNDTSIIPVKECVIFYVKMLFSQESEKNPIVVLKDMKFQELKHLIDFVYRGQVKLPKDQLDAFVSAAESLQIKGLSGQQKKKISERFANKTVSSREVCSSPVPRKRRRNSHTETNEDSQSEPGNESSSDSNMRENFMPTPIPLGMPSTSTASSSTGISSHSVSSQQSRILTDTRFPSHDQSSASSEQVLPDVQTVVKTEPEDPTEPLAQVFVPEPKNEEYVDDMAMLESGAGSSDMQGGTSQENTNNYPDMENVPHFNVFEEDVHIPDDILEKESSSSVDLLPEKTKLRYEKEYQDFQHWRQCKDIDFVNETVMLAYAEEKSDTYSPTSLWTKFSMLKLALKVHESIDISRFEKLYLFLRQKSEGYIPKKAKILSEEQIIKFLVEANDYLWLLVKVILIFGVLGACRREELVSLTIDDIENSSNGVLVTLKCTRTKRNRIFVIPKDGLPFKAYDLYRRYAALRPSNIETRRFFIGFRNGKCTKQVVGIHSIGNAPKKVAKFLKLDTPELYTGHCFRRSSATMLVENSVDLLTFRELGGWDSSPVVGTI